MVFRYDVPPNPGPLLQGEILGDLWEHLPRYPPVEIPEGSLIEADSVHHAKTIVMTAVCDLEQDFNTRFPDDNSRRNYHPADVDQNDPHLLPHVLLCEVYEEAGVRVRIAGAESWRRIKQNQDERYHRLPAGAIGDSAVDALPDLYLDFKRTIGLPAASLYEGIRGGQVRRVAVVPAVFIHDLMHRFYGFLSRVGLPAI